MISTLFHHSINGSNIHKIKKYRDFSVKKWKKGWDTNFLKNTSHNWINILNTDRKRLSLKWKEAVKLRKYLRRSTLKDGTSLLSEIKVSDIC